MLDVGEISLSLRQAVKIHMLENLGNLPHRGVVKNFIGQFPSSGWEMQTGGGRILKTLPNLKIGFLVIKKTCNNVHFFL